MRDQLDPRMPPAETCVLRHVLDRHARERPDTVFVRFEEEREWTWRELQRRVRGMAAALQHLGMGQGDPVLVWLPNGAEGLLAFLALNYIGAVHVPINTAYRGSLLAHVLGNSGARVAIVHVGLTLRLTEVDHAKLDTLIVVGGRAEAIDGLRLVDFAAMEDAGEPTEPERPIRPWDVQSIVYTSGTTGPSKGVLSSYLHAYSAMSSEAWSCVRDDDRFLINLPMFHIGGCFIIYSMLCRGGSIALVSGFKTDTFWRTVRETRSTAVFLLGSWAASS